MNEVLLQKKKLRREILNKRNLLSPLEKQKFDLLTCSRLEKLISERNYKNVHAYIPMGSEIDISPLLKKLLTKGIKVVTSKTLKNRQLQHLILHSLQDLEEGVFGTSHPANSVVYSGVYDIIIVPGLAFDKDKYRLGYGGGYYDKFLKDHPNAFTVGIGYTFQKLQSIPKEIHDACLDMIL